MNNKEQVWTVAKWAGIFLAVFLAVISIKEIISLRSVGRENMINTISVNGKGEAVTIPDIATFSFGVTETAKTVAEAQTKATEKINSAISAVKASGVEEKDIKTTSYNINPHYEYTNGVCTQYGCPGGKSVLTGYEVSQTIEVKVRDISKAGALFESVGALGVQNVNGLSFSVDKIESIKEIARAEAIKDAEAKAKKIAKDLGVRLVRVTSYYDSSDNGFLPYMSAREGMGGDMMSVKAVSSPEIPSGEQKITSQVTITYEIR